MCLNPRTILNKSKFFIPDYTSKYLQVPCGKCNECRQVLVDEWSARAARQIQTTIANGGMNIFVTMTFAPKCIPFYCTPKYDPNGNIISPAYFTYGEKNKDGTPKVGFPCFSKEDRVTFLNSLRKKYERQGYDGIKYIWCDEYGIDQSHSQRSHCHVIFHLPFKVDTDEFLRDVNHLWSKGLCFYSVDYGPVVTNEFAGIYCSKYMTKSVDFYTNNKVTAYITDYNEDGTSYINRKKLEEIKDYVPRHYQSQGYGLDLVQDILNSADPYTMLFDGVELKSVSLSSGKVKLVPVPTYIKNKLCYKVLQDGTRVLSDFGYEALKRNFMKSINQSVQSLELSLYNLSNDTRLTPQVWAYLMNEIKFEKYTSVHSFIHDFNVNIMRIILIMFKKCLMGKPMSKKDSLFLDTNPGTHELLDFMTNKYFDGLDNWHSISDSLYHLNLIDDLYTEDFCYENSIGYHCDGYYHSDSLEAQTKNRTDILFDEHPYFENYVRFYKVYLEIQSYLSRENLVAKIHQELEIKRTKHLLNSSVYV